MTHSHHVLNTPGAGIVLDTVNPPPQPCGVCTVTSTLQAGNTLQGLSDSLEAIWLFVAELGLQPKSLVIFFLKLS